MDAVCTVDGCGFQAAGVLNSGALNPCAFSGLVARPRHIPASALKRNRGCGLGRRAARGGVLYEAFDGWYMVGHHILGGWGRNMGHVSVDRRPE